MNITVTIPTLGIINPVFNDMIMSLNKQRFNDFKTVFITPKYYLRDNLVKILEKTDLDFTIVNQENKGFENAMNTALKLSGDLNLNMDDDAYYFASHVETYVKSFQETKAGMIFGYVNNRRPYVNLSAVFLEIQHCINKRPLLPSFDGYSIFFNSSGFLSAPILRLFFPFKKYRLNANPIGVNVGWTKDAIKCTKLREFSRKGTLNEAYIGLNVIKNDFSIFETNLINVKHDVRANSLSRGKESEDVLTRITELLFSPLVTQTYIDINLKDFDKAYKWQRKITTLIPSHIARHFSDTLDVVNIGVQEQWDSLKIREKYNEIIAKIKS